MKSHLGGGENQRTTQEGQVQGANLCRTNRLHTGWENRWLQALENNLEVIADLKIAMNLCPALLKEAKHYFGMHETENRLQDVK